MKQIAIICGTIFGSLSILVLLWVYYRFHKKRVEALATNEMSSTGGIVKAHANSTLEDDIFFWKSHPDPRKKRPLDTSWSPEKQSIRRADGSSYTAQKSVHPSTELIFAASPSGEQIEEEAPPHLEASSYGPTERIPTSSYQEVSKVHSQVPTDMNVHLSFDAPILISTVGTTISKYNFFAKQRGHNPSAVQGTKSAVIEEKTPTAPTALQKKIYSDVCKSSSNSLSKLQYKTPGETSTRPHNPRTPECDKSSLKESISRPEPIRSSLEERLMKEYSGHVPNPAEVNVRSSPQADIRADVASIAGTVIIHSMERWSRNLSRQPTLGMTESRSISSPPNQPSIMHDPEWGFDSHESVWEDIDQMLRKRSEDAGVPSESSSLAYFSPSSRIDSVPNARAVTRLDSLSVITRPEPEVPRRRVDFDNKRGVWEQRRISRITEADEDDIHSSLKSQNNQSSIPSEESTESVAVVSKAAIAIRSLPSDIRLIPAPTSIAREGNQSYPHDAIESDMTTSASTQVRLVQFMKHRSYQRRDSTGDRSEAPPSEALHEYHGKREMSHTAVVDGPYGVTAIEGGLYSSSVTARPSTNVPIIEEIPGSGRVDKIKSLREQSEKLRERQKLLQADPQYHQGLNMMSSSEEELLSDPAVVLGIEYMRTVDTSTDGDSTNRHIYESGQDETEIDLR
ncbi:hypothetical protein CPB86DRAFT_158282 [Serendipita vermifera]|nr:hypothetical protein CPB86DRAFT_158282 [Serendipita vermifera]